MIQKIGYEIRDEIGRVIEREIIDAEVTINGNLVTRHFLTPITMRSGQTISYFLPPGYNPVTVADPQFDPVPPLRPAGPSVTIRCYHCRGRSIDNLDALKSAGWTDIEVDHSSPASDPSYLGVCYMPLCRSKT